ncbi:MAG: hypothetical protein HY521_00240 [Proteobacteria bacterium]|nr:hypothetical protein [Pseudomonadota bacterium]
MKCFGRIKVAWLAVAVAAALAAALPGGESAAQQAVSYGGAIELSAKKSGRILWAFEGSQWGRDIHEIIVGPNTEAGTKDGSQKLVVRSPAGKTGPVAYGDEVELVAAKTGRILWVYEGSRWGGGFNEVLVGPNTDARTKDGSQKFVVRSAAGKTGPVRSGDEVELVAAKTGRILWVYEGSRWGQQFQEIIVGPNTDPRTKDGSQVLKIQ